MVRVLYWIVFAIGLLNIVTFVVVGAVLLWRQRQQERQLLQHVEALLRDIFPEHWHKEH